MAKVKAPLFSLEARGAIAKTVVYFPWKGLNVIREYVIPANPKSTAQMSQRGKFIQAVDMIHLAQRQTTYPLDGTDAMAYALLASTFKTPRTWFNAIVKLWVDTLLNAKVPIIWRASTLDVTTPTQIKFDIYTFGGIGAAHQARYGTSKTALLDAKDFTIDFTGFEWEGTTPITLGDYRAPTTANRTGYWYKCTAAGTTGATEPTWPTVLGDTVIDGTVTWECAITFGLKATATITGLASGQKYYLQPAPKAGDVCEGGDGGIYHVIVT